MDTNDILRFAEFGEILKRIQRTGWLMVGSLPSNSESVADHSYGTALIAFISTHALIDEGLQVDLSKVLSMAILHDLPESSISDIPTGESLPARKRLLQAKGIAEAEFIEKILPATGNASESLQSIWKEISERKTIESRIVHASDAVDMLMHALALERAGFCPKTLDEFFISAKRELQSLRIPLFMRLFDELEKSHLNFVGDRSEA